MWELRDLAMGRSQPGLLSSLIRILPALAYAPLSSDLHHTHMLNELPQVFCCLSSQIMNLFCLLVVKLHSRLGTFLNLGTASLTKISPALPRSWTSGSFAGSCFSTLVTSSWLPILPELGAGPHSCYADLIPASCTDPVLTFDAVCDERRYGSSPDVWNRCKSQSLSEVGRWPCLGDLQCGLSLQALLTSYSFG